MRTAPQKGVLPVISLVASAHVPLSYSEDSIRSAIEKPESYMRALYPIDDEHNSFMTKRHEVDRHISLTSMIGPQIQRPQGGKLHVRHIIPVKWFVHSLNKILTRVHAQPELYDVLHMSLLSPFPAASTSICNI